MSLEKPRILNKHFAEDADPKTLHTVPDVPDPNDIAQRPSLASYSTGFPPRSMAPPQAGGQPFYGQDVNGILKDLSANVQYMQAGNYYPFDSDFQKAVGGYNKFAVVLNQEDGRLYQSLVDNNTAPLSDKNKWVFFTEGKYLKLTGGELSGTLTVGDRLAVRNDQNSDISLEKATGDKEGYTIRKFDDDLFIYQSKNGATADKIAQYSRETDTWDFNVDNLTNKNVPVVDLNQFDSKKEINGYQKLPGGLIMQWGRVDYDKRPPEADVTVEFPIPYTNACLNAQASRIVLSNSAAGNLDDGGVLICSYSKTNLTVKLAIFNERAYDVRGFTWFTVGI